MEGGIGLLLMYDTGHHLRHLAHTVDILIPYSEHPVESQQI